MTVGIILYCDRPECDARFSKRTQSITVALSAAQAAGWSDQEPRRGQIANRCPRHSPRRSTNIAPPRKALTT